MVEQEGLAGEGLAGGGCWFPACSTVRYIPYRHLAGQEMTLENTVLEYSSTRVDHELMVQSRDQWLESSGTALASGYHTFVQIKALREGK